MYIFVYEIWCNNCIEGINEAWGVLCLTGTVSAPQHSWGCRQVSARPTQRSIFPPVGYSRIAPRIRRTDEGWRRKACRIDRREDYRPPRCVTRSAGVYTLMQTVYTNQYVYFVVYTQCALKLVENFCKKWFEIITNMV
jgi:hypothetical protein